MKRNLTMVAILAIFTASCLLLVACSKQQENKVTQPEQLPTYDLANMTLGQIHNVALKMIIDDKNGTIEERTIRTFRILVPSATVEDENKMRSLLAEQSLDKYILPAHLQILNDLRSGAKEVEYGDYKAFEALCDQVYEKHTDKGLMLDEVMELYRASFDFWTEHYAANPDKRPSIGTLGSIIDVGSSLITGAGLGAGWGAVIGAYCSDRWLTLAAECMSGCVSAPYYGPNPWCC